MARPTICIFCDVRRDLSKEHIWPQWLEPYLPPAVPNSHITEFFSGEGKAVPQLKRRSERPGAVHTRKVRAVCRKCNSGWMSLLESQVKEHLIALVTRRATSIDEETQAVLASWLVMKAIVAEHSADETVLTPKVDRTAFFQKRVVPDYFRVFVALHAITPGSAYYRQSTTVSRSTQGPMPPLGRGITRNIELVMFLIGPLCVYLTAARVTGLNTAVLDPVPTMHRLWPSTGGTIDLASTPPVDALAIETMAKALDRLVAHPRVRYGGPLPSTEASAI